MPIADRFLKSCCLRGAATNESDKYSKGGKDVFSLPVKRNDLIANQIDGAAVHRSRPKHLEAESTNRSYEVAAYKAIHCSELIRV